MNFFGSNLAPCPISIELPTPEEKKVPGLALVTNMVSFLRDSPKRMQWFRDIAAEHEEEGGTSNIPSLCATRWSMRATSVASICGNYRALLEFFNEVDEGDSGEVGFTARGFVTRLLQFDTFFSVELLKSGFFFASR